MKLTAETVKNIARGCINVTESPDGMRFERFTGNQYRFYESSESARIRSRCPAGVRLEFITDSDFISFGYTLLNCSRNWHNFDLFVDGTFVQTAGYIKDIPQKGTIEFKIADDKKAHRVTVHLAHLTEYTLYDFTVADGSTVKEAPFPPYRYLAIGDSITQGMEALSPSSTYTNVLAECLFAEHINQGLGGGIFDADTLDKPDGFNPDYITVAYGTNDWGKWETAEPFRSSTAAFMKKLNELYGDSKIYIITPTWRSDIKKDKPLFPFEQLYSVICDCCSAYPKFTLIDGRTLVPNMPSYFGDKFVHPNDLGFMHMAMNLLKII